MGLNDNSTPLILIHDGGGTIFSYYLLDSVERPLYGIFNPYFYSGESWKGGIPEMASYYVGLIKKVIPKGPVIIGGWSLGGLVALEMAKALASDSRIEVIGIVMIRHYLHRIASRGVGRIAWAYRPSKDRVARKHQGRDTTCWSNDASKNPGE